MSHRNRNWVIETGNETSNPDMNHQTGNESLKLVMRHRKWVIQCISGSMTHSRFPWLNTDFDGSLPFPITNFRFDDSFPVSMTYFRFPWLNSGFHDSYLVTMTHFRFRRPITSFDDSFLVWWLISGFDDLLPVSMTHFRLRWLTSGFHDSFPV